MHIDQIREQKRGIVERYGPWTAGCIHLADQVYTFDEPHWDTRLRRFLQIVVDLSGKPLESLRILDLACLEGQYGIEFALQGAHVQAIEGREANLAKVRFVKDALKLDNLALTLGDVRDLDEERYGRFDVVLCLGILYHLDAGDAVDFAERIWRVCQHMTIIDTHVSPDAAVSYTWKGHTYWGRYTDEHNSEATAEEKLAATWSSLDNVRSFQFTRASLYNLLRHVGFTSVYECLNPYEYHNPNWPRPTPADGHVVWKDRITLVAIKGRPQTLLSSPITDSLPERDRPEKPGYLDSQNTPAAPHTVRRVPSAIGRRLVRLYRILQTRFGSAGRNWAS